MNCQAVRAMIPSLPCSGSQPAISPHFLMDELGTNTVWFQWFELTSEHEMA